MPKPTQDHFDGSQVHAGGRPRARLLFILVAITGLILDVLSKIAVVAWLDEAHPVRLLGGVLTLRLIRNSGAAFSLGEQYTVVFPFLYLAVLIFVLVRLVPRLGHPGWATALGLLCAGIGGNLIDRLFRSPSFLHGQVVDFLQLPKWPIFNLADMMITSAAVLILVLTMIKNVSLSGQHYPHPPTKPPKS